MLSDIAWISAENKTTVHSNWVICEKLYLQRCGVDLGELARDSIWPQDWQYQRPITPLSQKRAVSRIEEGIDRSCVLHCDDTCKNKYLNITLLPLFDLLWMPPSKPTQKTQDKKALDVVLKVTAQRVG